MAGRQTGAGMSRVNRSTAVPPGGETCRLQKRGGATWSSGVRCQDTLGSWLEHRVRRPNGPQRGRRAAVRRLRGIRFGSPGRSECVSALYDGDVRKPDLLPTLNSGFVTEFLR